jgi:hypothetical protein
MLVRIGACVRTTYGTGPYIVKEIDGPCTCVKYLDMINGLERPSKPHYHLTVIGVERHEKGRTYWLNGHTLDGRSVWTKDRLIDASQLELFA